MEEKKAPGGFMQGIKKMMERRRAVRVTNPQAQVDLCVEGKTAGSVKVEDLSTRGIGLALSFMPGASAATIRFKEPEILAGLELEAEIRAVRRLDVPGETLYLAGYEFRFASDDQAKRLYRWLSTCMESGSRAESTATRTVHRMAQAATRRPEPTLLASQEELKQCAALLEDKLPHFGLPETKFFIAVNGHNIVSVLPLIRDTAQLRLPADEKIPGILAQLRGPGRNLAQVWTPAFSDQWVEKLGPRNAPLQKLDTLFSVFSLALVYAIDYGSVTDIVAEPPPFLEEFFKMWLFDRLPDADGLMHLQLEDFEFHAQRERPELISHITKIRKRVELSALLATPFQPDREFLKAWLPSFPQS